MEINIDYKPHSFQKAFHNSKARFKLLIAGRRGGKTFCAGHEALKLALSIPNGRGCIVAPNFPISKVAWEEFFKILPTKLIRTHNKTQRQITLINGHIIECKSAFDGGDSFLGQKYHWAWLDEAALISRETWEQAIRATLIDYKGVAFFTTTPRGRNWIWELYNRCQDPFQTDYECFQFSTYQNPFVSKEEIEFAKSTLPERLFQQEFLAEFLADGSEVFRFVRRQAIGHFEEPIKGVKYTMGVDLARIHDFTVLTVIRCDTRMVVAHERFNQIDWSIQKKRIIALAKRYNAEILLDSTGIGDPIFEDLKKVNLRVEGFKFNNKNKQQLIENLIMNIEQNELTYPYIPELVSELEAYEIEETKFGNFRYNAPTGEGSYDDCVISLALATWKLKKKNVKIWSF